MEIAIKNLQSKIPINPKRIKRIILDTLSSEGVKKPASISVCFVNDKKIKELNLRFLKRSGPTDVISFDLSAGTKEIVAEIAVSTDTAIRQSKIYHTTYTYETLLYVIHGLLHILGYDDRSARQRKLMQEKTESILDSSRLGKTFILRARSLPAGRQGEDKSFASLEQ
ncbi:MAG: rRNA maturation RNase YbeY [Candidatus Omnitrophica bacterium]|nr:rRNA maturation RNase YbeY [Candidatus Omnitrophota bacterium]